MTNPVFIYNDIGSEVANKVDVYIFIKYTGII